MHGLALRAVQLFVTDCFGSEAWASVINAAGFEFHDFEAMLNYEDSIGRATLAALERAMERPREELLEDFGTYLVSHPHMESLRRLLRFGGVTFEEFMHSLDDLPGRVRMAVPDFELPGIELREHSSAHFSLTCRSPVKGFGHVLVGILRTMADDYGALALVEHRGGGQGVETVSITLLESTFAEGRSFVLGGAA